MKTTASLTRTVMVTVGGLMFIGLLTAGISPFGNRMNFIRTAQAQEESQSGPTMSNQRFRCSNETLAGRYAVIGDGFVSGGPPPAPLVPFATVSLMTMDGDGNLSNDVTRSINGQISRGVDYGTYTVNADCTGTMTISTPTAPFPLTFDIVVANLRGAQRDSEFYFIATNPGGAVASTAKRIK